MPGESITGEEIDHLDLEWSEISTHPVLYINVKNSIIHRMFTRSVMKTSTELSFRGSEQASHRNVSTFTSPLKQITHDQIFCIYLSDEFILFIYLHFQYITEHFNIIR